MGARSDRVPQVSQLLKSIEIPIRYTAPVDIVTAITGASGAAYAQQFITGLVRAGVNVHLVVSPLGRRLLHDELGMEQVDLAQLAGGETKNVTLYNYNDVGSKLASGSFLHDGMVIVPCSSNTLAECAHGLGGNLISRAAAVTLKERRKLILVHREMPLSPIDITNYQVLTQAGAILAPANPGFYLNPTTIGEVVDFVAGRTDGLPDWMTGPWIVGTPETAKRRIAELGTLSVSHLMLWFMDAPEFDGMQSFMSEVASATR